MPVDGKVSLTLQQLSGDWATIQSSVIKNVWPIGAITKLTGQKRVIITTPFTAIEEQHYNQLFEEMCNQCGLDAKGAPRSDDWNPEDSKTVDRMRSWLTRLRQTCLHPEVSGSNRKALGAGNGPLRTVAEVLEVMMEFP